MISIIITAYKEARTIGKVIHHILKNKLPKNYEIIVTTPDDETAAEAKRYAKKNKKIKILRDKGKGKPAALNLAVSKSKGDILVLTDGEVFVSENSIEKLLNPFANPKIGATSGNPVSLNSKRNKYGFWAYVLTNVANDLRKDATKCKKKILCSGYLFAIRKKLFPRLPENLLSEDGYISQKVYSKGYFIAYLENSKVYVKYPDNFSDWIKQKKRSAGGYNQIKKILGKSELRSFSSEALGAFKFFKYVSNVREFIWLMNLYVSRLYLWFTIFIDVNLRKKDQKQLWVRVESTK